MDQVGDPFLAAAFRHQAGAADHGSFDLRPGPAAAGGEIDHHRRPPDPSVHIPGKGNVATDQGHAFVVEDRRQVAGVARRYADAQAGGEKPLDHAGADEARSPQHRDVEAAFLRFRSGPGQTHPMDGHPRHPQMSPIPIGTKSLYRRRCKRLFGLWRNRRRRAPVRAVTATTGWPAGKCGLMSFR